MVSPLEAGKGCKALKQTGQETGGVTLSGSVHKSVWIWHLRMQCNGEHGGDAELMAGLEGLF